MPQPDSGESTAATQTEEPAAGPALPPPPAGATRFELPPPTEGAVRFDLPPPPA
ncbi:hypothetical protein H4J02_09945 [Protaetiibacter sp. SSC-01]|uniref:hypothetical protein n=1 Tax=Protaetiibacter sp. SSC-01 TaxID=2759943 RepID=UPI001656EC1D|nr:hypothetical protein [Protaetiibacter sp. SSC-01]QNO36801.1 hypothetical protein H4J02_09945 [Protaetiibacter sp. SSC-01]